VAGAAIRMDRGSSVRALALLAHPIGFLWLVGTTTTSELERNCRLVEAGAAAVSRVRVCRVNWYTSHRPGLLADWDRGPLYFYNGADQLYSTETLRRDCCCGIFSGIIFVAHDFYQRRRESSF